MRQISFVFVFLACFASLPVMAAESFVVSFGLANAGYPDMDIFESILEEAYSRVGVDICFDHGPMPRAHEEARIMKADASAFRTSESADLSSNLVQVPAVLFKVPFYCFSMSTLNAACTWCGLKRRRVGYVNGVRIIPIKAEKEGVSVTAVKDFRRGIEMLKMGRLDVLIAEESFGKVAFKENGVSVFQCSGPLFTTDIFHYVNKRHVDLAPRLAKVFKTMREDGTMVGLLGKYCSLLPADLNR